jgi:hypothetical protein
MKRWFLIFIVSPLIILWIYTGVSKLLDFPMFAHQLDMQNLPEWLTGTLKYTIPTAEILTALLLCSGSTLRYGLMLSTLMILGFTIYTIMVLTGFFPKVPCSCGGVISTLSWKDHLTFNLFFLTINLTALSIWIYKERRTRHS